MTAHDGNVRLHRMLIMSAARHAVTPRIDRATMTPWSSATFAGARHEIVLAVATSPLADAWLADLPEADLPLRGQLVADLRLVTVASNGGTTTAIVEILTVDDR